MKALVIPSNRPDCLKDFFAAWEGRGGWDVSILVEDNPERSFVSTADKHYSWREIQKIYGQDAWIFSRRDSAIRCFGFLAAWHLGAEYVLTLDDDCYPRAGCTEDFFGQHVARMTHPRWLSTVPGLRVRGLPGDLGGPLSTVANMGLWSGVPDLDARTQLESPILHFIPPPGSWIIPRGQYAPLSGMNLCVKREAIPLWYYPLMGEGQPYSRFDDIWAGIIAKKVCDHLGWSISVGEPFVEHRRASDPHVNLAKEAPGALANETFWQIVDNVTIPRFLVRNAVESVWRLGVGLKTHTDPYISQLGKALGVWVRLLSERPEGL